MAAGSWVVFDHAKEFIGDGTIDLDTHSFGLALVSAGYTPSLASHSAWADASSYGTSASGYSIATLDSVTWARVSGNKVRFDAADEVISASGTMNAKYAIIRDNNNNALVAYCDMEESNASGLDATQFTFQFAANGIFEIG